MTAARVRIRRRGIKNAALSAVFGRAGLFLIDTEPFLKYNH